MSERRVVEHATCLGCGCGCDDIAVVVDGGWILEARGACALGAAWFGNGLVPAAVEVDGVAAPLPEALDVAARLLAAARRPLVYFAPELSCEAQREGAGLADRLRATLDTVTSATVAAGVLAAQERGRAGATLGELRNRADVVLFWGVDPADRYPRFSARYAPEPVGVYVSGGRAGRTVVAVDVGDDRGPSGADRRFAVDRARETGLLAMVRAVAAGRGREEDPAWELPRQLAATLLAARYAAIVYDAEPGPTARPAGRADALVALGQTLNERTRCAVLALRAGGNRSGADAVLAWQTGFPMAIDFARGLPRYRPGEGSASARLAAREIDAVVILGDPRQLPAELLAALGNVQCVVIGPRASEAPFRAHVAIDSGVAGVHEGELALRMDDVPLRLRPSLDHPRPAAAVVRALSDRVGVIRPAAGEGDR